jgi:hypothetical protein
VEAAVTEAELAWAAGMFEGEGSVRINAHTQRNRGALLVDLANTSAEVVAFFRDRWGGSLREYVPGGNRRTYYRWRAASRMAAAFLNDVLPYLRTATYRERALLGLEYQTQKSPSPSVCRTDAYYERQNDYYERMAALNRRGAAGQLALELGHSARVT